MVIARVLTMLTTKEVIRNPTAGASVKDDGQVSERNENFPGRVQASKSTHSTLEPLRQGAPSPLRESRFCSHDIATSGNSFKWVLQRDAEICRQLDGSNIKPSVKIFKNRMGKQGGKDVVLLNLQGRDIQSFVKLHPGAGGEPTYELVTRNDRAQLARLSQPWFVRRNNDVNAFEIMSFDRMATSYPDKLFPDGKPNYKNMVENPEEFVIFDNPDLSEKDIKNQLLRGNLDTHTFIKDSRGAVKPVPFLKSPDIIRNRCGEAMPMHRTEMGIMSARESFLNPDDYLGILMDQGVTIREDLRTIDEIDEDVRARADVFPSEGEKRYGKFVLKALPQLEVGGAAVKCNQITEDDSPSPPRVVWTVNYPTKDNEATSVDENLRRTAFSEELARMQKETGLTTSPVTLTSCAWGKGRTSERMAAKFLQSRYEEGGINPINVAHEFSLIIAKLIVTRGKGCPETEAQFRSVYALAKTYAMRQGEVDKQKSCRPCQIEVVRPEDFNQVQELAITHSD